MRGSVKVAVLVVFVPALVLHLSSCAEPDAKWIENTPVASPTSVPTQVPLPSSAVVIASGTVWPAEWVELSFLLRGLVAEVPVVPGDSVQAGHLLARLDAADLECDMAQARAALAMAQARLAVAKAGATPEEIAAAEGGVVAAQGGVSAAEAALTQAKIGVEIANANQRQSEAAAEAAEAALAQAQGGLNAAKAERDVAQAQFNLVRPDATGDEVAAARAGVGAAEAQVSVAQAAVDEAEAMVSQALAAVEAAQGQTALAQAGVAAAEAQVEAAGGWLTQAEAQRDRLQAGATPEEIAVLEAQIEQADAELARAQATFEKMRLVAPFPGTVVAVEARPGETISPGQVVVVLANLETLRVHTEDLDQFGVAKVRLAQEARVLPDALPGRVLSGRVAFVSSRGIHSGDDVVYPVFIELVDKDADLRWGMTAMVEIVTTP